MSRLDDTVIRTRDAPLQEHIDDVVTLWNRGLLPIKIVSTVPSDTPADGEIRLFSSGATRRIYVYFPGDTWRFVTLT